MQKAHPNTQCDYCGIAIHVWPKRFAGLKHNYCSNMHYRLHQTKPFIIKKGYKRILIPNHPRSDGKGYVREHLVIIEAVLGRPLRNGEVVHHKNGNKLDNNRRNLSVFANHSVHMKAHIKPI